MAQSPDEISFSGDFNVQKITIIGTTGSPIDIKPQIKSIEIYETIFYPFTTAKLYIEDNIDLLNTIPFTGEEIVNITCGTPSQNERAKTLDFVFHGYKVTDRVESADRTTTYILHCISVEAFLDASRKVGKSFSGKISDIVEKIITDPEEGLSAKKSRIIEPTANSLKYISNYWSPIKNIRFLADHAKSLEGGIPSYVFFENRDGYNFVTLEKLYKNQVLQKFTKDNYVRDKEVKDVGSSYGRIVDIQTDSFFDFYDNSKKGLYGTTLHTYDILLKWYKKDEYAPNIGNEKSGLNSAKPFSLLIENPDSQHIEMVKHYSMYQDEPVVSNNSIFQKRKYLTSVASFNSVKITIAGRSDYTVGYPVELDIPKSAAINSEETKDQTTDEMLSGKYLIAEINHSMNGQKHTCTLTLIKDSLGKK